MKPNNKTIIYFLVKTFTETCHAKAFLDGTLFMNSLSYFATLDEPTKAIRSDRHEGTVAWFQPEQIQLKINDIQIPGTDLAAPLSIKLHHHFNKNIFCMHASYIGGAAPYEFPTTSAFEEQLKIPEDNIKFGMQSVIITNPEIFLNKVKQAVIENKFGMQARLVDYYDPATFHGHFKDDEAVFKKHLSFAYQREYRIAVDSNNNSHSPLVLEIGNIRDIAKIIPIATINSSIKIEACV